MSIILLKIFQHKPFHSHSDKAGPGRGTREVCDDAHPSPGQPGVASFLYRLSLILILVSPRIFTISLTATLSFLWPRNSWNEFLPLIFVIAFLIRSYMICIIRMMLEGMRAVAASLLSADNKEQQALSKYLSSYVM